MQGWVGSNVGLFSRTSSGTPKVPKYLLAGNVQRTCKKDVKIKLFLLQSLIAPKKKTNGQATHEKREKSNRLIPSFSLVREKQGQAFDLICFLLLLLLLLLLLFLLGPYLKMILFVGGSGPVKPTAEG